MIQHENNTSSVHLPFLDGVRGLAALYVVIYHIVGESDTLLPASLRIMIGWAKYGHYAVDIFIVLSGYCLMLPVAGTANGHFRGGLLNYFKRRARRILPPYYAALALALLLSVIQLHGVHPHFLRLHIELGNFLSHIFLVHNLTKWIGTLDAPLWSVATEWQIYFIFPAVLLPVWRRFGSIAAVAIGFCLGLMPHFLFAPGHNFDLAAPWYIGLFSLGMIGAGLQVRGSVQQWLIKYPKGLGSLALFLMLVTFIMLRFDASNFIVIDPLMGLLAVCLILLRNNHSAVGSPRLLGRVLSIFETRPVVFLGLISYSLYLTHMLAMLKVYPIIQALHLSQQGEFLFRLCVCLPWTIFFAYGFHLAFERPFMRKRRQSTTDELAVRAALSPAP